MKLLLLREIILVVWQREKREKSERKVKEEKKRLRFLIFLHSEIAVAEGDHPRCVAERKAREK